MVLKHLNTTSKAFALRAPSNALPFSLRRILIPILYPTVLRFWRAFLTRASNPTSLLRRYSTFIESYRRTTTSPSQVVPAQPFPIHLSLSSRGLYHTSPNEYPSRNTHIVQAFQSGSTTKCSPTFQKSPFDTKVHPVFLPPTSVALFPTRVLCTPSTSFHPAPLPSLPHTLL
ncbi:hypothetical protein BU23DRAFT_180235 [Bimuria novae-zelandiae CBS 107.79]|uniref:Uncharacterized protein n=1 Tax=Bimuria novae-zelandiae CBS 107.79 TaxID=1447943 RepID=A0A6A5V294_9PLEO|nr:hypothetical protein BU23DRAFT_180235 [Bimuria novae-zelandiae CBS 107.79]